MTDEIKVSRPAPQYQPRQEYAPAASQEEELPKKSSKIPWIVLAVVVVLLVVGGVVFRDKIFGSKTGSTAAGAPSGYQAVFLTNGQVYFGKIGSTREDYVTLSDIYYLQVGPQQGSAATPNAASSTAQQQITLVKLGQELHGPVDFMHINRTQILFYEDLKADGQVVKAIQQDKAASKTAPAAQTPPPAAQQQAPAVIPTPAPAPAPTK